MEVFLLIIQQLCHRWFCSEKCLRTSLVDKKINFLDYSNYLPLGTALKDSDYLGASVLHVYAV